MINIETNKYLYILKTPIAFISLFILSTTFIISIFAYIVIPDKTKNANRQILQIALQPPGFHQHLLKIGNQDTIIDKQLFSAYFFGHRDSHLYIPYDSLWQEGDFVISRYKSVIQYHNTEDREVLEKTNRTFWLGTDKYGRDILSRLILGLRISLMVGFLSVLVSIVIGITLGSIAGYYGSIVDKAIMLLINTSWSIPTLLMTFAIIIAIGKGILVIVLAIGLTMWVDLARIVRGQVIQVKGELYVRASQVLGYNDMRTIVYHILPNIMGSIWVIAAANFATAILVEAGLSYLGLGIQPPAPSLGNMLQESYAYATGGFVYLAAFPILTIMILVLCFNLLGTALRDSYDIKSLRP